ncbi:MAG: type II secretion system F family protein [Ruminococcus sp.]|nr:type II secretion system F family protein [Ruminococcus sp.]
MKTFIYTATDVQGNTVKNARMQAEDVNDFLDKINEKGLFCSSYKETNSKGDKNIYKFKTKELSFNCRQLSAMISSGLTLVKALDILYKEQPKEATKRVFREVYDEVQKGRAFSEALKMQDGAFPEFFISMIAAGEASGQLDVIMKRLEEHYDKEGKLANKIRGAITYPIILLVLLIAVILILAVKVFPIFRDMAGDNANAIAKFLFAFSDSLMAHWYVYLLVIGIVAFVINYLLKIETVRLKWDKFLIKMPMVGKLLVKVYTGRFSRTLSNLYSSGIPMVESLERSSKILGNTYIVKSFETVVDEVKQGDQLSAAIQRTGIFESMFCSIIYVGEESGALDTILQKTSEFYEEESDSAIGQLVGMIEPVMLIIMGIVIGLVLAGVFPLLYSGLGDIE